MSQRAFRLRREKHDSDLEAKVEQLKTLLATANYENNVATSRMHRMEAELSYYRGLLFTVTPANSTWNSNSFITSYPVCDYRPAASSANRFVTAVNGRQVQAYGGMSPALVYKYQRAGSNDSSSTGTYPPVVELSLQSFSMPSE
jgi:hypothetical protein